MFNVTKKHIENGKKFEVDISGNNCPIALAIREEFGTAEHVISVGSHYSLVGVNSYTGQSITFEHSADLAQWLNDFDAGMKVDEKTLYIHEENREYFLGFQEDIGKGNPIDSLEIY